MHQFTISTTITNRNEASVSRYLSDVSRIPMLSVEEETELARKIQQGGAVGEDAKNRLVTANLRFVITVAKTYDWSNLPLIDRINEGNIGLMKAAERFNTTFGFKFISYAVWWIRQQIMQAIANTEDAIRLPQNKSGLLNKINKASEKFYQENQRQPTAYELSEMLDVDEDTVKDTLASAFSTTSLDAPVKEDSDALTIDFVPSTREYLTDDNVNKESLHQEICALIGDALKPTEQAIITELFGIGCAERTAEEVATTYGLSRERVRQIRINALRKMRENCSADVLRKFL